jgi:hypothetical protein
MHLSRRLNNTILLSLIAIIWCVPPCGVGATAVADGTEVGGKGDVAAAAADEEDDPESRGFRGVDDDDDVGTEVGGGGVDGSSAQK